jgi:hypothetical protein
MREQYVPGEDAAGFRKAVAVRLMRIQEQFRIVPAPDGPAPSVVHFGKILPVPDKYFVCFGQKNCLKTY